MSHTIKVVLVHGWGMNSGVWQECVELLPDWMSVECVDLPGHGRLAEESVVDFESMVASVADTVSTPVIWVGWSLGGLVCLKLAERFPEKVLGLCLVSTNPCFVKRQNWSTAIEKSVFDEFSAALKKDINKTIKRFLAIQVVGSKITMVTLKKLLAALESRGMATSQALELGLQVLSELDLRDILSHLIVPRLWVFGAKDTLVPVAVADVVGGFENNSSAVVIEGAAHAPFISHPKVFSDALIHFASELR